MGSIGPTELIVILVVVLVIFGAGKLPEVGGAIGKGLREFRKASRNIDEDEVAPPSRKQSSKRSEG